MEENKELEPIGMTLNIEHPLLGNYRFECRNEDNIEAIGTCLENIGNANYIRLLEDETAEIQDRVWITIPRKVLEESVISHGFLFEEEENEA